MVKQIFSLVANSLLFIGRKTGLTYNEVNILVYYLMIPLSWTAMFDFWLGLPVTSLVLFFVWLGIWVATRHTFKEWCDWAFQDSVDFLKWFNNWGGNYILNSVIICVLLPLIIYGFLISILRLFFKSLITASRNQVFNPLKI